jgi:hypothetical protein
VVTLLALPVLIKENQRTPAQSAAPVAALAPGGGLASAAKQLAGPSNPTAAPGTTSGSDNSALALAVGSDQGASALPTPAAESGTPLIRAGDPASAPPSTAAPSKGEPTGNGRFEDGVATFEAYDDAVYGQHSCAHRTLPLETVVTVTNTDSGRSTWCVVRGHGPADPERMIVIDSEAFADIADLAGGAVPVRITW